jgi:hypothetical protein
MLDDSPELGASHNMACYCKMRSMIKIFSLAYY